MNCRWIKNHINLYIILIFITSASGFANPLKKSDLSPTQKDPTIPGTRVPIEEMNTAPTPPPTEENLEKTRFILKTGKEKEEGVNEKSKYQYNKRIDSKDRTKKKN